MFPYEKRARIAKPTPFATPDLVNPRRRPIIPPGLRLLLRPLLHLFGLFPLVPALALGALLF